jgi:hypothetical protein
VKKAAKKARTYSWQNRLFSRTSYTPYFGLVCFVELDELIPNICRTRSENVRLGSYETGANENSYFSSFWTF